MAKVDIKAYIGTKMLLLTFNWEDGKNKNDFLGFAIKRSPGFKGKSESFLPNRISFNGPQKGVEFPSDNFPIQKFMWWDNRLNYLNKEKEYTYTVIPVTGKTVSGTIINPKLELDYASSNIVKIKLLPDILNGIGTYFNRAVVSSQAFSKQFPKGVTESNKLKALEWLADGLQNVVPNFINNSTSIEGAIYHLEDKNWIIPALEEFHRPISLVIDRDSEKTGNPDKTNDYAISKLGKKQNIQLIKRTKASIMHNKFLITIKGNKAESVLMGSANFTTDGLTQQANYLHTFECPELAELYLNRKRILEDNPTKGELSKLADWSEEIVFNKSTIRVCFSPEKKPNRRILTPIIEAVRNANSSVIFSLFSPTDKELRNTIFEAADKGKMMFGLINKVSDTEPENNNDRADERARIEIYHRSEKNKDVYGHKNYKKGEEPDGFWWESSGIGKRKHPVYIHHKFILIDGETDNPILYTGSANMSNNSNYNNDENLLEIKNNTEVSRIYFCEFMRLYEHYRARVQWDKFKKNPKKSTFKLTKNAEWAIDDYTEGTPKYKSRLAMVGKK